MPLSAADANPSSLILSKCGTTLLCFGRSLLLWVVVLAVLLVGALRRSLFAPARGAVKGKENQR
jgi:hypothetical protein